MTGFLAKMELEEEFKTKPVGIFIFLQKLLIVNGCIPFTPKRRYVNICYQMYRVFWFILITMFLIQDIVSINMVSGLLLFLKPPYAPTKTMS